MKKYIALVLMFACLFGLVGCSDTNMIFSFNIAGVSKIELCSGNDGTTIEITDKGDIKFITDNINSLKFEKAREIDGDGWSYRLRWYDENENMIEEIVVMNESRIDYKDCYYVGMVKDDEIDTSFFDTLLGNEV